MRMIRFLALTVLLRASPVYAQVSLPLRHLVITSGFGNRVHPVTGSYGFHYGIDLRARSDTVFAVLDGRVENAGYNLFLGIFIRIGSGPFTITYGHLSQCFVCIGDSLATGSPMGVTGSSGRVTGEHLHFAVQFFHRYIDPLTFLTAAEKISNH